MTFFTNWWGRFAHCGPLTRAFSCAAAGVGLEVLDERRSLGVGGEGEVGVVLSSGRSGGGAVVV